MLLKKQQRNEWNVVAEGYVENTKKIINADIIYPGYDVTCVCYFCFNLCLDSSIRQGKAVQSNQSWIF